MAITWRDGIIVGAIVVGLILLVTVIAIFVNQNAEASPASTMALAHPKSAPIRPKSTPIGTLGAFGYTGGNAATATHHEDSEPPHAPPPHPPAGGGGNSCSRGHLANRHGLDCKNTKRAALDMNNKKCPSSVPKPQLVCERPPNVWSINSTYLGQDTYTLDASPNQCVAPKGDISTKNIVTVIKSSSVTLTGGHAELHVTNSGPCDARLVNIIVQLIKVKHGTCQHCSDSCDDQDNDENHDSDHCDIARQGQVIAATAEESPATRHCPHGAGSPATICNSHGNKNSDCIVDVPYNTSVHLLDSTTGLPINLNSYTIPKNTKCGHEKVIKMDYEFALTLQQLAALNNEQFVIKILLTYDTCCNKGHTCGIDYDCDHIIESIRTISLESDCFSLPSNTSCTEKCAAAELDYGVSYITISPLHHFPIQQVMVGTLTQNTTSYLSVAESTPPPATFIIPELCCDTLRDVVGAPLNTLLTLHLELLIELRPLDCDQTEILNIFPVNIDCVPQTPVNCQVSEWSSFTPCAVNCTNEQVVNCTADMGLKRQTLPEYCLHCYCFSGEHNRTRTIVVPPANGGAACPALIDSEFCNSPSVNVTACTCPGPTWNLTVANLANAIPGENCVNLGIPSNGFEASCNLTVCDTDCSVSEWTTWSACTPTPAQDALCIKSDVHATCSSDCFVGTQLRSRTILVPPTGQGTPCPSLADATVCNSPSIHYDTCPVSPCAPSSCSIRQPLNPFQCPYADIVCSL